MPVRVNAAGENRLRLLHRHLVGQAYVCSVSGKGRGGRICGLVRPLGSGGDFLIFGAPSRISFSTRATNARSSTDLGLRGRRVGAAGSERRVLVSVLAKRGALMSLRRPTMR